MELMTEKLNAHTNAAMTMTIAAPLRRRSRRMTIRLLPYCSAILLLAFLLQISSALPLFLVMSGRGKCVTVEAAAETSLKVNYEAPGVFLTLL